MVYLNQHEFADSNQQHAFVRLRADHLATLGVKNIIEISEKDFEKWKNKKKGNLTQTTGDQGVLLEFEV